MVSLFGVDIWQYVPGHLVNNLLLRWFHVPVIFDLAFCRHFERSFVDDQASAYVLVEGIGHAQPWRKTDIAAPSAHPSECLWFCK